MKPIFLEITLRLEDSLNEQIRTTIYSNYTVMVCEKDDMFPLLEKGTIYDVITFKNNFKTIDKHSEEFWEIIKHLEQKRTIAERYERMLRTIKNTHPELLEEELRGLVIGGINDYLIYVAIIVLLLALVLSPTYQSTVFDWISRLV